MKIGFDNDKYLKMQSEYIMKRIEKFGDKLYLEFGGKLLDDYHASRVLPGFEPDSKIKTYLFQRQVFALILPSYQDRFVKFDCRIQNLVPKVEI